MKFNFPNCGDKKTVSVESLMKRLREHATSHPDVEYREFLMLLMGSENGRNLLVNMLMKVAEKNGVEIVAKEEG